MSCDKIVLDPDLTKILSGQPQIKQIQLQSPNLIIYPQKNNYQQLLDLWQVLTDSLSTKLPLTSLSLSDGQVLFHVHKKEIAIQKLQANLELGFDLILKGSSSSPLWQNLSFNLTGKKNDLSNFQGELKLSQLQMDKIKTLFPNKIQKSFKSSLVDLDIGFQGHGLDDFKTKFKVYIPKLQAFPNKIPMLVQETSLKGELSYNPDKIILNINRFQTKNPQLVFSGSWEWKPPFTDHNIRLKATKLDVEFFRKKSQLLKDRNQILDTVYNVFRSGNLTPCLFKTHGSSKSELSQSLHIDGNLNKGSIFLPKIDLLLHQVSGQFTYNQAVLKAKNIKGQTDLIQISSGKIELGINPKLSPFSLTTNFQSRLETIPKILSRVIPKNHVVRKLNELKEASGDLSGSFALSHRHDKWHYALETKDFQAQIQETSLSHPINILKGQIRLTPYRFSFDSLELTSGDSYINKLTGYLDWQKRLKVSLKAASSKIQISQIPKRFRKTKGTKALPLPYLLNRGNITFTKINWQGLLKIPKTWDISIAGAIEALEFQSNFVAEPVQLISGHFLVTEEDLSFNDCLVEWGNSKIKLKGELCFDHTSISKADVNISGHLGPQSVRTIFEKTDIIATPLTPQGPIYFSRAHLQWQDKTFYYQGQMEVAESTNVQINMKRDSLGWSLQSCSLQDNFSKAIFSIKTTKNGYKGSFDGFLTHQTIDRMIKDNRYFSGQIQGQLNFSFSYPELSLTTAKGTIKCNQLKLPGIDHLDDIHIKTLSLKAETPCLQIRSARIMWSENPLSLNGTIKFSPKTKQLKLHLWAERMNWTDLKPFIDTFGKKGGQESNLKRMLTDRFQGSVQIYIRSFQYQSIVFQPLESQLTFQRNKPFKIDILNSSRLCTVPLSGQINLSSHGWETSIDLSVQGEDLKKTLSCLQKKEHPFMTGLFDFSSRIRGTGTDIKDLLKDLHGPIQFESHEGRITHFELLAKILSILNTTEIFFGQLPNMDQEGLGYKDITLQGQVSNGTIQLKKGVVDGDSMEIGFRGDIDFLNQELDLIVLVAPLKTVDRIFEKIPFLSNIMGGHLISVPIRVSGQTSDPKIVPLSPTAVSSELFNIMKRSIKYPIHIFQPLMPKSSE